jgi:hypothetical protein
MLLRCEREGGRAQATYTCQAPVCSFMGTGWEQGQRTWTDCGPVALCLPNSASFQAGMFCNTVNPYLVSTQSYALQVTRGRSWTRMQVGRGREGQGAEQQGCHARHLTTLLRTSC